jgi:hypothetical protein
MIACSTDKPPSLRAGSLLGRYQGEGHHTVRLRVGQRRGLIGVDEQRDARGAGTTGYDVLVVSAHCWEATRTRAAGTRSPAYLRGCVR